jgi:hypothetical protein
MIELTNSQIVMVGTAGIMRQIQYIRNGRKPTNDRFPVDQSWTTMIEGALSEYALAQYLNRHWEGTGLPGGNDLGEEEVRVSDLDYGSLIVRPKDNDEKRYWLLTGSNATYTVRGYMYAKDAKKDKYWRTDVGKQPPAWFVPQKDLIQWEIK